MQKVLIISLCNGSNLDIPAIPHFYLSLEVSNYLMNSKGFTVSYLSSEGVSENSPNYYISDFECLKDVIIDSMNEDPEADLLVIINPKFKKGLMEFAENHLSKLAGCNLKTILQDPEDLKKSDYSEYVLTSENGYLSVNYIKGHLKLSKIDSN